MIETAIAPRLESARVAKYRQAERALWAHHLAEPRERVIELPRHLAGLRVLESGSGPAVLLVHGSGPPGAASVWTSLTRELPDFRCVMVDLPGDGLSAPLDEPRTDYPRRLGDLLAELLSALDIGRAHLVAWSIGGIWALRLAQLHPSRVDRMVQMGFCPIWDDLKPPAAIRLQTTPIGAVLDRMPVTRAVVRSLLRRVVGHGASLDAGRIPTELVDWMVALMRHTDTARNDRSWLPRLIGIGGARPGLGFERHELEAIAKPMLYVHGSNDWPGSREVAARTTALMGSGRIHVIERGGHAPWLDDVEGVAGEVRRFLAIGST